MTSEAIHQLIGNAVVDRDFRQAVLQGRPEVFEEFGFSPEEQELIRSIRAHSVQELAGQLLELQTA